MKLARTTTSMLILASAALLGCGDDPAEAGAEIPLTQPSSGSMSGYFSVVVATPGIPSESISEARVGDTNAYDLVALPGNSIQMTVQGNPEPGPVDIAFSPAQPPFELEGVFQYHPPLDSAFRAVIAMGAATTLGVQNGVPSHMGALMSPGAQIVRQTGAYFPVPLFTRGFLSEMAVDDVGPAPDCALPDTMEFLSGSLLDALPALLSNPDEARIDSDIRVHNLAVGGLRVHEFIHGPAADNLLGTLLSTLVLDPRKRGDVESQLDEAEKLEPTVVVIPDLYYYDVAAGLSGGEVIDPSLITPIESFREDLDVLLTRLAATGADVFTANMPPPSLLPVVEERRARMISQAIERAQQAGEDEQDAAENAGEHADTGIAEVDRAAQKFNQILELTAARHPTVHVVDIKERLTTIASDGLEVGGELLSFKKFGGLVGLDGTHLTDTGNAVFANAFLEVINEILGTRVPLIELGTILAADRGSPRALAEAGFDATKCEVQ